MQELAACDLVFFATPHNVAMNLVPELLAAGARVIDLSADYRIRDAGVWSHWYGEAHASPELLAEAVYGLPELNREKIADCAPGGLPRLLPHIRAIGLYATAGAGTGGSATPDCEFGIGCQRCRTAGQNRQSAERGVGQFQSLRREWASTSPGNRAGLVGYRRATGAGDVCAAFVAHRAWNSLDIVCATA